MINAYKNGQDLYSMIASRVYHNNYEDNLEHYPDGSIYEDGKKRRTSVKSLLLGILYGMGIQSIANAIKGTREEAKEILDGFYAGFPKVRKWMDETEEFAKKNGYVEDWYGRRRRLPDIMLPPYEVSYVDAKENDNFNPFLHCVSRKQVDNTLNKWLKKCDEIKSVKDYENIKAQALKEGIVIKSNTSFISQAVRQCVNSRIQGGAATMTKVAMIKLYNDQELKDLGFHMLINVHDELIGECPQRNAEAVAERLAYIMRTCIEDYCVVPFKCDAEVSKKWYEDEYRSSVLKEYNTLLKDMDKENAFEQLCVNHSETLVEDLREIVKV